MSDPAIATIAKPWSLDAAQVAAALRTDSVGGLSSDEAARRREHFGENRLREERPRSRLAMFLGQFANFMIGLLAVAAVISAVVGDWQDSLLIGLIVFANAGIGFFQEQRAERAVTALKRLAEPTAHAWRDGALCVLPAADLVPGDLISLKPGDLVPADSRLVEAAELQAAEAPLTGESLPIDKHVLPIAPETPLSDRTSMVFAGTAIAGGRGRAIVTSTGMSMELGKIATLLSQATSGPTPLEQRLSQLSRQLAMVVLTVCGVVFLAGLLWGRARDWEQMLLVSVSLAVAAIPEGLPAVITVTLALGTQQMSRRKAIVRQLAAVETLGSVDVICSDKTGTLTRGEMEVVDILATDESPEALLRAAAVSNDAQLSAEGTAIGSGTEVALIVAAQRQGLDVAQLRHAWPRRAEFPFSSARKRMSTLHGLPDGSQMVLVKGAAESVLERSVAKHLDGGPQPLQPEHRRQLLADAERLAARGRRVLGLAQRPILAAALPENADAAERDLTFLGFVGLIDPIRPEVRQAIAECRSAGIRPVMITGDHPGTARAVAEDLGILSAGELLITGPELDELNDEQLAEKARLTAVYARVTPEHKLRIVRAHQSRGSVVSMTGDGVNDAPALKQADIGVAMGIQGTDVSKQSARMVLADDNFATIVAAVEEGRVVYDNIRKFVRFLLTTNTAEILVLLIAILLGWPVPLLPVHLLWINLVTDGLPALALGFEPAERGLMLRPPRRREESLFAGGLGRGIVGMGLFMALGCLVVFWLARPMSDISKVDLDQEWMMARTMVFVTLSQFQLFYVLSLRSSVDSFWSLGWRSNYRLTGAVAVGTMLQLAVVYVPPLARIFHTRPLPGGLLCIALGTAASACLLAEFFKWWRRTRQQIETTAVSATSH